MSDNKIKYRSTVDRIIFDGIRNGTSSPTDIDFCMDSSIDNKIIFGEVKTADIKISNGQRQNAEFIINGFKRKIKAIYLYTLCEDYKIIYGVKEIQLETGIVLSYYSNCGKNKYKWITDRKTPIKKVIKGFFK